MTASQKPDSASDAKADLAPHGPTAGGLLREARLKAGMHLAVLSVTLKVPVRELEALEANALDMAKGPAFYRGLASSVCRHLQADPTEILALLPPTAGRLMPVHKVSSAAVSASDFHIDNASSAKRSLGKVFGGAVLMLILTAALVWLPNPAQWPWVGYLQALWSSEAVSSPSTSGDAWPLGQPSSGDTNSQQLTYEVENQAAAHFAREPTSPEPAPGLENSVPGVAVVPDAAPSAAPDRQASTLGPEWVFSATDDSWLEVRNAQSAIVWSGTLKAGETTRVRSLLPVSVVVGRAPAVTVRFRDQPFDLKPHTRVTVARFEVKE